MSESRFMKTVLFGGYDRAGVEQKFERLSAKLFRLENELSDSKAMLAAVRSGSDEVSTLQKLLETQRGKLSAAQAEQETLSQKLRAAEAELSDKDNEIEKLKAKIASLQDQVRDKEMKVAAYEADDDNKPARAAIAEVEEKARVMLNAAKKDAAKLEENSRKLSDNIIAEANNTVSRIIYDAEAQGAQIIANAQNRSAETEAASGNLRAFLLSDVERLIGQIQGIRQALDQFGTQSSQSLGNAAQLLSNTDQILRAGGTPVYTVPQVTQPVLPPQPELTPVEHFYFDEQPPAPQEAPPQETLPQNDAPPAAVPLPALSPEEDKYAELERLQQMANAIAGLTQQPSAQQAAHAPSAPVRQQTFPSFVPDLTALANQADAIAHGKRK